MFIAAKRIDVHGQREAERDALALALRRELRAIASGLHHPNIVTLRGVVVEDPTYVCLLMELCDRGCLRDLLDDAPATVTEQPAVALSLAHDIASGSNRPTTELGTVPRSHFLARALTVSRVRSCVRKWRTCTRTRRTRSCTAT